MNVTYYPYQPILVRPGQVVVIDTASSKIYSDLVEAFRDEKDLIRISGDDFESLDLGKWSEWYGDPKLELNLDHQFQRIVLKRLSKTLTNDQRIALMDQGRALVGRVLESSFLLDLPLAVSSITGVDSIIKFSGLHFSEAAWQDVYATIETLIKTIIELDDQQLTVLTNVSHYLNVDQMQDLVRLVNTTTVPVPVLIIEFSFDPRPDVFKNCSYIWIDEDFSDSRELE